MAESEKWEVATNDHYLRIVSAVVSLATGALALPILFIREFLGVPAGKPIKPFLTCSVWLAWTCLTFAILLGLGYSWFSIKWVKAAFDQPTFISRRWLEFWADAFFVLMGAAFVAGIAAMFRFLVNT